MTSTDTLTAGTFASVTLVTDTVVYEIVRRTDKSLWIRPAQDAYTVEADGTITAEAPIQDMQVDGATDPHCPNVIWTPQMPNPAAATMRVGLRKDGTYRLSAAGFQLRPCAMVDGKPCRRTDYRR